jgi:Response regulator containing CheY-like receiver, AAA-type ATPase, and DNA-binding domains
MKSVLVIEDNRNYRDTLSKKLSGLGINVITSENGVDGLQKISTNNDIDLILLDILLPIMDGKEFIYELQGKMKSKIPIIILTNLDKSSYLSELPAELDYMVKADVSIDEVADKVKEYLT